MNPPTEQLIRDYLNQVSIAARSRLRLADRQALLDRIRARIEAECGGVKDASEEKIGKILAGIGDPVAVVEAEVAKVRPAVSVPASAQHFHGAAVPNGQPGGIENQNGKGRTVRLSKPAPLVPPQATSPETAAAGTFISLDPAEYAVTPTEDVTPAKAVALSAARRRLGTAAGLTVDFVTKQAKELARAVRARKLEAVAVLLLGAGGALFPPVWVLGALLALASRRTWDIPDKLIGIVLPVFLVVLGTALVLLVGPSHSKLDPYFYEAWLAAGRLSRVFAAGGAYYLLWRMVRGRRPPRLPPWNVPHKLDL
jgi:hypothetical protein